MNRRGFVAGLLGLWGLGVFARPASATAKDVSTSDADCISYQWAHRHLREGQLVWSFDSSMSMTHAKVLQMRGGALYGKMIPFDELQRMISANPLVLPLNPPQ